MNDIDGKTIAIDKTKHIASDLMVTAGIFFTPEDNELLPSRRPGQCCIFQSRGFFNPGHFIGVSADYRGVFSRTTISSVQKCSVFKSVVYCHDKPVQPRTGSVALKLESITSRCREELYRN